MYTITEKYLAGVFTRVLGTMGLLCCSEFCWPHSEYWSLKRVLHWIQQYATILDVSAPATPVSFFAFINCVLTIAKNYCYWYSILTNLSTRYCTYTPLLLAGATKPRVLSGTTVQFTTSSVLQVSVLCALSLQYHFTFLASMIVLTSAISVYSILDALASILW